MRGKRDDSRRYLELDFSVMYYIKRISRVGPLVHTETTVPVSQVKISFESLILGVFTK